MRLCQTEDGLDVLVDEGNNAHVNAEQVFESLIRSVRTREEVLLAYTEYAVANTVEHLFTETYNGVDYVLAKVLCAYCSNHVEAVSNVKREKLFDEIIRVTSMSSIKARKHSDKRDAAIDKLTKLYGCLTIWRLLSSVCGLVIIICCVFPFPVALLMTVLIK